MFKQRVYRCFSESVARKEKDALCSQTSIFSVSQISSILGSFRGSKVIEAVNSGFATQLDYSIFLRCDFPFENLIFEGGGNKGTAYVGALQVRGLFLLHLFLVMLLI